MKSNLINKSKKLTYKKPTIKKLQISRLSIENNTKIKKIQNKRKTEYNISSYNNSPSKNTFTEANHSKNIHHIKIYPQVFHILEEVNSLSRQENLF